MIRPGPPAPANGSAASNGKSLQQFIPPLPAQIPMYQMKSDQIPIDYRPLILQFTIEFISLVFRQFEVASIQNIKKFGSLRKTLHNLSKNEITRRLKRTLQTQSKEKDFLLEVQKSDDNGVTSKDPDATYQSVVIANTIFFLRSRQCLAILNNNGQIDCQYDLEKVRLFTNENISNHFDGLVMDYPLTHASECMRQPIQALETYWPII